MRFAFALLCIALLLPAIAHAKPPKPTRLVVVIADDVGRMNIGTYRDDAPIVDTVATGQWATPNLDAMATAGIRFDGMVAQSNCAPSRIQILMGYHIHRPQNRIGNVFAWTTTGWRSEVTPNVDDRNWLFSRAEENGYSTFAAGKLHLWPDRIVQGLGSNIGQALGIDEMPIAIQANAPNPMFFYNTATVPLGAEDYLSHNCFVSIDLSTTDAAGGALTEGYNNELIIDAAKDYITSGSGASGSHFMWVAGNAPHAGSESTNGADCTDMIAADPDFASVGADDRPPGDTTSSTDFDVFGSGVEYFDTLVGELRATLSLDPTTGTDILCFVGDNGVPQFGAPSEIPTSPYRGKGSLYPAGVLVPFICEGRGIAAGSIVPQSSKFGLVDLHATLDDLMSASGSLPNDGKSFADCFDSNSAATNCEPPSYVLVQRASPLGGAAGNSQAVPTDGDSANWSVDNYMCIYGEHWTHRIYEPNVISRGPFYEEFFDESTATNQYFDPGDEEATTGPTYSANNVLSDSALSLQAQKDQLNKCHSVFTNMTINGGHAPPTFSGASF